MGAVTLGDEDVEITVDGIEYWGDVANVGNPHFVCFVDRPARSFPSPSHGPRIELNARFPQRTNVEFVRVRPPDVIDMRVWERGVGETLSCGTGACAAAAVAHNRGRRRRRACTCACPAASSTSRSATTVRLGGPVVHVFDVDIEVGGDRPREADLVTEDSRAHQSRQRRRLTATEVDLGVVRQRALLVGTTYGTDTVEEAEASLDELALLADTAGAEPVHAELQRRRTPDPATYIGKGKAEELRAVAQALDIDVVIFDDELTPAQQRNLEKLFAVDVVDRVALILDIFAQHATSQEGSVQVELAQLRYRLPAPARPRSPAEPAGRRHRDPRSG